MALAEEETKMGETVENTAEEAPDMDGTQRKEATPVDPVESTEAEAAEVDPLERGELAGLSEEMAVPHL